MTIKSRTSLVLGITGGVACGKSEVGRILGDMGFMVCDADHVAHDLMKKGSPVYRQVVERFGTCILSSDGEITRSILGEIIFKNPGERDALNRMVHPAVRERLEGWIGEMRGKGTNAIALVPLLFESKMENLDWDAILCVACGDELVFQRMEKRGLDRKETELRIASQMPVAEKERRSDYVVSNTGTLEELEKTTRETLKRIMAER